MPDTTESTTVDRPIHEAFALVSDFSRLPEWDPTFTESRQLDDGPIGVGTRFQATGSILGANFELQLTVESIEEPTRIVLRGEGDGLRTTEDLRLRVGSEDPDDANDGTGTDRTGTDRPGADSPGPTTVTYHSAFDTDQADWVEKLGQPAFTLVGRKVVSNLHDWLETAEPTSAARRDPR